MGLDITVGAWNAFEQDPDYLDYLRAEIEKTNHHLREVGLPEHREPIQLNPDKTVSYQMWGYSGLHRLRRLAALLHLGLTPEPITDDTRASEAQELEEYYGLSDDVCLQVAKSGLAAVFRPKRTALFSSPSMKGPNFDHLVHHSDAEGFYLPIDFSPIVVAGKPDEAWYIGSSYALKRECEVLAEAIGLPLDLDPESEEVWEAAENSDPTASD